MKDLRFTSSSDNRPNANGGSPKFSLGNLFQIKYCAFIIALSCAVMLTSCSQSQSVINDYTAMVEELETKSDTFSEQDWKEYAQRYEDLETRLQKCELTQEQKSEVRKLQGRLAAAFGKHSATFIKAAAKDAAEQIKAFSDGFMEGLGKDGLDIDIDAEE